MGGLFFDVEAVRTESRDRGRRPATTPSTRKITQVVSVNEAKKYYPLFGLFANVALVFSGQFVSIVSKLRAGAADPRRGLGVYL